MLSDVHADNACIINITITTIITTTTTTTTVTTTTTNALSLQVVVF
jgi:hypothetical protein